MNSALRRHVRRERAIQNALAIVIGTIFVATYFYAIPFILLAAGSTNP